MVLKQLKKIRNNNELSKYDFGKDSWGYNGPDYQGYGGWNWGSNKFTNTTPQIGFSNPPTQVPKTPINNPTTTNTASGLNSAANTAGQAFGIASSALGFGSSMLTSFGKVQSVNQLQNDAGYGNGSINGINYTRLNNIDVARENKQVSSENTSNTLGAVGSGAALGSTIGSVAGPFGMLIGGAAGAVTGLVGGLFGGAARKRKLRRQIYEAQQLTDRTNQFNRSDADSSALQQQYAAKYGDDNQLLYANKGKDLNNDYFKKKRKSLKQPQ